MNQTQPRFGEENECGMEARACPSRNLLGLLAFPIQQSTWSEHSTWRRFIPHMYRPRARILRITRPLCCAVCALSSVFFVRLQVIVGSKPDLIAAAGSSTDARCQVRARNVCTSLARTTTVTSRVARACFLQSIYPGQAPLPQRQ